MATIVTRAGKGSALTWTEGDANITNLNTDITNIVNGTQIVGNATNADNIDIATTNGNTSDTLMSVVLVAAQTTGNQQPHIDSGLTFNASTNALTATTFVGALSGNASTATSANNININTSNGANGDSLMSVVLVASQNTGNQLPHIDTNGLGYNAASHQLLLGNDNDNQGQIRIYSDQGGSTNITGGFASANLTFTLPSNAGSSGQVLSTNGSGTLSWVTRGSGTVTSVAGTGTVSGLTLSGTVTSTGSLTLGGALSLVSPPAIGSTTANTGAFTTLSASGQLTLSSTLNAGGVNGTSGQVLQSTGTGVQWATLSGGGGGITDLVQDLTPQLGGNLDVNSQSIVSVSNGNIVIAPNGTGMTMINNIEYDEKVHALGTTSGTIAPNAANGNVQTITLNGNLTINAFTSPVQGQSVTLIINTGGTGRTLTSTMKFAGGEKTLSTTNTTDILSIFYDGTNYWASLGKDFK
jgi:hypothetical protein